MIKIKHLKKEMICLTCKTEQDVFQCKVEKPTCDVCNDSNFENLDYYNEMKGKNSGKVGAIIGTLIGIEHQKNIS